MASDPLAIVATVISVIVGTLVIFKSFGTSSSPAPPAAPAPRDTLPSLSAAAAPVVAAQECTGQTELTRRVTALEQARERDQEARGRQDVALGRIETQVGNLLDRLDRVRR